MDAWHPKQHLGCLCQVGSGVQTREPLELDACLVSEPGLSERRGEWLGNTPLLTSGPQVRLHKSVEKSLPSTTATVHRGRPSMRDFSGRDVVEHTCHPSVWRQEDHGLHTTISEREKVKSGCTAGFALCRGLEIFAW